MILSLSMIVRNEQDGIAHVLQQAAQFCDERIVLDTGSTDDTVQVAKDNGAEVYEIRWPNSFAKARNVSKSLTSGDWVMHLDGHDNLPPESLEGFIALRAELQDFPDTCDAVITPMCIVDDKGVPLMSWPRERITRRHLQWNNDAHTIISPRNPVYRAYPVHTLQRSGTKPARARGVLKEQYESGDRSPRTVFYYARETFWSNDFEKAIPLYNEWLAMNPCNWEKYSGLLDLAACYELTGDNELANITRLKAVSTIPTRAEAWAALALDARKRGDNDFAIMCLDTCLKAKRPQDGFVIERWYSHDYIKQLRDSWLN